VLIIIIIIIIACKRVVLQNTAVLRQRFHHTLLTQGPVAAMWKNSRIGIA